MLEDMLTALAGFRRNKMRSILSLLGIVIGTAAMIVITSLGKSTRDSVINYFGSVGM